MRLNVVMRRLSETTIVLVACALAGAGAAAVAIAVWPSLAGTVHAPPAAAAPLTRARLGNNKQHLTKDEQAVLLAWAKRYRACAAARGIEVAAPRPGRDEVVLSSPSGRIERGQLGKALPCIGTPPPHMSFTLMRDGRFHLFRAKACLLPVRRKA